VRFSDSAVDLLEQGKVASANTGCARLCRVATAAASDASSADTDASEVAALSSVSTLGT
jgi:hypothetical protein